MRALRPITLLEAAAQGERGWVGEVEAVIPRCHPLLPQYVHLLFPFSYTLYH